MFVSAGQPPANPTWPGATSGGGAPWPQPTGPFSTGLVSEQIKDCGSLFDVMNTFDVVFIPPLMDGWMDELKVLSLPDGPVHSQVALWSL